MKNLKTIVIGLLVLASCALARAQSAENLNLTISEGDYLAIVGKNGSGKSTLMKTILGFNSTLSTSTPSLKVSTLRVPLVSTTSRPT